jgi:hypothetical protein
MNEAIGSDVIAQFKQRLEAHPVYAAVTSLGELQCFMQHHVYSVWDFMSLIKYLQAAVAPASTPWVPRGDGDVRRFINELVLEEESDEAGDGEHFTSHFELYLSAMEEIGADTSVVREFVASVAAQGVHSALRLPRVPQPAAEFSATTFAFIDSGRPHEVAAALALGREHIIPCMFRAILDKTGVSEKDAPKFHYYLNRHIHLDEDFHAPLSLRLLNGLCSDAQQRDQAIQAAHRAVSARVDFWDGVHRALTRTPD